MWRAITFPDSLPAGKIWKYCQRVSHFNEKSDFFSPQWGFGKCTRVKDKAQRTTFTVGRYREAARWKKIIVLVAILLKSLWLLSGTALCLAGLLKEALSAKPCRKNYGRVTEHMKIGREQHFQSNRLHISSKSILGIKHYSAAGSYACIAQHLEHSGIQSLSTIHHSQQKDKSCGTLQMNKSVVA